MQVNGEAQNLTPPHHAETPYAGVIKIAEVITSWTPTPVQKFVTIRPGVSFPRMCDYAPNCTPKGVSFGGGGFLQLATAKAPGRILTHNTPKLAVLRKDVPFRGFEHKI